jgi:hypothetical protein
MDKSERIRHRKEVYTTLFKPLIESGEQFDFNTAKVLLRNYQQEYGLQPDDVILVDLMHCTLDLTDEGFVATEPTNCVLVIAWLAEQDCKDWIADPRTGIAEKEIFERRRRMAEIVLDTFSENL